MVPFTLSSCGPPPPSPPRFSPPLPPPCPSLTLFPRVVRLLPSPTQEPYTEKADVWSLGCVTYHMLMLRPPFDGTNPLSVAHKIVEGAYDPPADPPPASGAPPYSEQLKRLVGAMMTVDPHK